jgi:hypothetical protein
MPAVCPTTGLYSFPIDLGFSATDSTYTGVDEDLAIDIKWASRSTPPQLSGNSVEAQQAILDEVTVTSNIGGGTTLRYRGYDYKLDSVRFCKATHTKWLIPSDKRSKNKIDVILSFTVSQNANNPTVRNIVFVSPLYNVDTDTEGTRSFYFQAMTQANLSNFSVREVLPSSDTTRFAYYSTCLEPYNNMNTPQFLLVFVAVEGVPIGPGIQAAIQELVGIDNFNNFPNFTPTYLANSLSINRAQKILNTDAESFNNFVASSTAILNYAKLSGSYRQVRAEPTREDELDAYKCVPLDPEKDIKDGKLTINLNTGAPLSTIEQQRLATKEEGLDPKRMINPETTEVIMTIGTAVIMCLFVVVVLFYAIVSIFTKPATPVVPTAAPSIPGPPPATAAAAAAAAIAPSASKGSWLKRIVMWLFAILILGGSGFVIGLLVAK